MNERIMFEEIKREFENFSLAAGGGNNETLSQSMDQSIKISKMATQVLGVGGTTISQLMT